MVFLAHSGEEGHSSNGALVAFICVVSASTGGIFLPVQAAVNNVLKRNEQLTTTATVGVSLFVGALGLTLMSALSYIWTPPVFHLSQSSWWHWTGGIFGVLFLSAGTKLSPLIGYSTFFISIITGQLALSLLSDICGLLGPARPGASGALSVCGVLLAAVGAGVVSVYKSAALPMQAETGEAVVTETYNEIEVVEVGQLEKHKVVGEGHATSLCSIAEKAEELKRGHIFISLDDDVDDDVWNPINSEPFHRPVCA